MRTRLAIRLRRRHATGAAPAAGPLPTEVAGRPRSRWARLALGCATVVAAGAATAANLLVNGGFEGEYGADGLAPGWRDNSFSSKGPIQVGYGRETRQVRSGEACQRIACTRIGYISPERTGHPYHGAWQMLAAADLPLHKGRLYRVRAAVRADRPIPVEVVLRLRSKPWTKYVARSLLAGPEWSEADILFACHVDDPKAAFFLRSEYLGTVWVDDAGIEELTTAEALQLAGPATSGNLLHNGSFDLDRANWMGERGWDNPHDATFRVDEAEGDPCIRLTAAAGQRKALRSDAVPVARGRPLVVSCRVRSAEPGEVVLAALYETAGYAMPAYGRTTAQVGRDWATIEARGVVPFLPDPAHAFVDLTFAGPGPVWVDDVVLRQDDGPLLPSTRAAILADRHPWGLYTDADPVGLRVLASVPEGEAPALRWRLEDFQGATVRSGELRPGPGRSQVAVDASDLARGYYHAVVEWACGERRLRNESTFCILPSPQRAAPARTSFFGGHFQTSPVHTALAKAAGLRWIRLWPPGLTLWRNLEPTPGEWRWRDAEIQRLLDEGFCILGMLESPPAWVTWNSPTYWQEWETYVATVVERYRGRIDAWEIQNEPNLQWWWLEQPEGGKRAEWYLEVLRHVYPVVKRTNPQAVVHGGCVGGDFAANSDSLAFARELIDRGGLEFMDVLSFHYYHTYAMPMPLDEMPDPIGDSIARMRQTMRAVGRELPIANTEGGTYNPAPAIAYRIPGPGNYAPIPPAEVARLLVRQNLTQWAAGVERFFYYNCFIDGSPLARAWDSFVEGDGQPRPAVAAYATMTWLLDGARFERSERPGSDLWIHHFRSERGPLAVAWTRTGTIAEHAFPGALRIWDLMGRETVPPQGAIRITPTPQYILLAR